MCKKNKTKSWYIESEKYGFLVCFCENCDGAFEYEATYGTSRVTQPFAFDDKNYAILTMDIMQACKDLNDLRVVKLRKNLAIKTMKQRIKDKQKTFKKKTIRIGNINVNYIVTDSKEMINGYCNFNNNIFITKLAEEAPDLIKTGILAHELGHKTFGHGSIYGSQLVSNENMEYDADKFAAKIIGAYNMRLTLRYLCYVHKISDSAFMKARIKRLRDIEKGV